MNFHRVILKTRNVQEFKYRIEQKIENEMGDYQQGTLSIGL